MNEKEVNIRDKIIAELLKAHPEGTLRLDGVTDDALEDVLNATVDLSNRAWRTKFRQLSEDNDSSPTL
jgi:hypothetical protein